MVKIEVEIYNRGSLVLDFFFFFTCMHAELNVGGCILVLGILQKKRNSCSPRTFQFYCMLFQLIQHKDYHTDWFHESPYHFHMDSSFVCIIWIKQTIILFIWLSLSRRKKKDSYCKLISLGLLALKCWPFDFWKTGLCC